MSNLRVERLRMRLEGMSTAEIAQSHGVSRSNVSTGLRSCVHRALRMMEYPEPLPPFAEWRTRGDAHRPGVSQHYAVWRRARGQAATEDDLRWALMVLTRDDVQTAIDSRISRMAEGYFG